MSKFMYLFRHKDGQFKPASAEEMERVLKAWMVWFEGLQKAGPLVQRGERLEGTGKVVRGKAKAVTDGPYAETKDSVGGFMIVQAKDLDHAIEISKGCPILDRDGVVEVRPVLPG
jgi:hypothetical protein